MREERSAQTQITKEETGTLRPAIEQAVQLVCFDLDGTLVDSEPLHQRAKEQLVKRLGYKKEIDYKSFVGRPNREFWQPVVRELALKDENEQTLERKQYDLILEMAEQEGYTPSDGLSEVLGYLAEKGIRMAVCSSSDRHYVERMVALLGLADWFPVLVGGDEVPHKKPAPDIYCKALALCGVAPENAVAVEDSASGIAAAAGAGMACIGYRNPTSGPQDLSQAVCRVGQLVEMIGYF